nr:uncharacterized protein LOC105709860 [Aotus nancymaae]
MTESRRDGDSSKALCPEKSRSAGLRKLLCLSDNYRLYILIFLIFNKSKCQNCFKPRESHLLNDEDLTQAKPIYGGWLLLAPDGTDFDNPVHRSRKWQRRFFILYEHGLLRYALDEMVSVILAHSLSPAFAGSLHYSVLALLCKSTAAVCSHFCLFGSLECFEELVAPCEDRPKNPDL